MCWASACYLKAPAGRLVFEGPGRQAGLQSAPLTADELPPLVLGFAAQLVLCQKRVAAARSGAACSSCVYKLLLRALKTDRAAGDL